MIMMYRSNSENKDTYLCIEYDIRVYWVDEHKIFRSGCLILLRMSRHDNYVKGL